jgi:hypothetical protein
MRDDSLRGLSPRLFLSGAVLIAGVLWLTGGGRAQTPEPGVKVTILAPPVLTVEQRAVIEIKVRVTPPGAEPLRVTPRTEGDAVEVVKGRLLRADAVDPTAELLHFKLPIVVRSEGTSVLNVGVSAYSCPDRCQHVQASASRVLTVRAKR